MSNYYGKYKAIVVDINDPDAMGRIKVRCPAIYGEYASGWCMPCIPNAIDYNGDFFIPPVGEGVWIEFEAGNTDYPIYSGSWYSKGKTPVPSYAEAGNYRIISFKGAQIVFQGDLISIKSKGATLVLSYDRLNNLNRLIDRANTIISNLG